MTDDLRELEAMARRWMDDDPDPATREETARMLDAGDTDALREAFGARLEFGTAGLRGVIGPGPNRMNRALVRRVTAGLADHLLARQSRAREMGVVVGGDARRLSPELAEDTARVLVGKGIRVHFFEDFVPTPVLAYAVRRLGAAAGVIVTASHNPPEYNGYKVYWDNAAQIVPPHDRGISAAIDRVDSVADLAMPTLDGAREQDLLRTVGESVLEDYYAELLAQRRHPDVPKEIRVVYTAMHGVGGRFVTEVLHRAGYANVHPEAAQYQPDGEFPTVRFPNPEEDGAMDLSMALAREHGADVVLANDPDADRLAVGVPTGGGDYRLLTGNEIGCLLAYYLLTENPPAESDPLVMTTIVSSRMLQAMAHELGAHYDETLTGFKWIANVSQRHARERGWHFVMGYEEALGYTVGPVVPDKDGVGAALIFTEIAAVCRSRGLTLVEYLEQMVRRFGSYVSHQHSLTLPGQEGAAKIAAIMDAFRAEAPDRIGEHAVVRVVDYADGHEELPPSNVLAFDLEGGGQVLLRPSGTEPKIKYYFELSEQPDEDEEVARARERATRRLDALVQAFLALAEERVR
ncbi:MAG TPA: phospho-sugar mutase [Candidatus Krumholzibacteria bacterium]|nr:phospho-sugar mutase [Candidatus Krumholzibacteria bacterium]